MPYGGNDWLALTQEPTLEPEILICDPHHHFCDFRSERVPYQRYLLHELVADVGCGHDVRSTVFIEARSMYRPDGPVELRPVGEVEFVQGLAAASAAASMGAAEPRRPLSAAPTSSSAIGSNPCWRRYGPPAPTAFVASAIRSPGTRTRRSRTGKRRGCSPAPTTGQALGCWREWVFRST